MKLSLLYLRYFNNDKLVRLDVFVVKVYQVWHIILLLWIWNLLKKYYGFENFSKITKNTSTIILYDESWKFFNILCNTNIIFQINYIKYDNFINHWRRINVYLVNENFYDNLIYFFS